MIQVVPHVKIYQYLEPVDFRKGIDGLAGICRGVMNRDPMCGAFFLFINRPRTSIKALIYDGQGFWCCQKRLSAGKFSYWDTRDRGERLLSAPQMQALLFNGDPFGVREGKEWRKVS
jgi:transposase